MIKPFKLLRPLTPYALQNKYEIVLSVFDLLERLLYSDFTILNRGSIYTTEYGLFQISWSNNGQQITNIRGVCQMEIVIIFKPVEGRNILLHILKDYNPIDQSWGVFRLYPEPNGMTFTDRTFQ
jgi:hypothetical protein